MSYPILTARAADAVAKSIKDGDLTTDEQWARHIVLSDGPVFDHADLDLTARQHQRQWAEEVSERQSKGQTADEYLLEAFMASRLHATLSGQPIDVLQDMGFWRYLALFPYRWFLQGREGGPGGLDFKPQDYGGVQTKPDGKESNSSPKYQLLLRTFLWGKTAYDASESDPYRRATMVNETGGAVADVWHSHIVRVQLGQLGRLPHAFLDSICDDPPANSAHKETGARPVEKRLTRMKHTVLFDMYDLDEARAVTDHEKTVVLDKAKAASVDT